MRFLRLAVLPGSLALVFSLLASFVLLPAPRTMAAGAADADARELVRLINGARAASGKHALVIDLFLASKARDGAIPCPDDRSKTIAGRAHDFAATGQLSHYLRKCDTATFTLSSKTFVSTLQTAWGYGTVGEILLVNGGYGNTKYLYTYRSFKTYTYSTTAHAMAGWAGSSSHWSIVMGTYDRVGCGAWSPGGSTYYYDCVFSRGGPSPMGLAAPPTTSPFGGSPPTSAATPRTSGSVSGSGSGGSRTGGGGTRSVSPVATTPGSSSAPSPTPSPTASQTPAPAATTAGPATPAGLTSNMALGPGPGHPSDQGVIVVSGVALLGGLSGVLLFLGQRARRGS